MRERRRVLVGLGLGLAFGIGTVEAGPPPGVVPVGPPPGVAPPGVAPLGVAPPGVADELARLDGHRVDLVGDGYRIADVAGEGAPLVGVVERRGAELWLRPPRGAARRLRGPLAVPRIAGPGYKVWIIGRARPDGSLIARRLGVLSPPHRR